MLSMSRSKYCASMSLMCLAVLLAACASQREPAQKMIGEIEATSSLRVRTPPSTRPIG